MIKQVGIFRLIVGDPSPIFITIEQTEGNTLRFQCDHLIDLKHCVDEALRTSKYRYEKYDMKSEAEYLEV